jgi:hypothetical protein
MLSQHENAVVSVVMGRRGGNSQHGRIRDHYVVVIVMYIMIGASTTVAAVILTAVTIHDVWVALVVAVMALWLRLG